MIKKRAMAAAIVLCVSFSIFFSGSLAKAELPAEKLSTPKSSWSKQVGSEVPQVKGVGSKVFTTVALFAACIIFSAGLFKHFNKKNPSADNKSIIEIISRKNIGPKHALLVIEVEGRRLLVSQSPENMSLITELLDNAEFAASDIDNSYIELEEARAIAKRSYA